MSMGKQFIRLATWLPLKAPGNGSDMANRRPQIRIVRWGIAVPERACCTACGRLFSRIPSEELSVEQARDELERLFLVHTCTNDKVQLEAHNHR
jgi:hypothetical protein